LIANCELNRNIKGIAGAIGFSPSLKTVDFRFFTFTKSIGEKQYLEDISDYFADALNQSTTIEYIDLTAKTFSERITNYDISNHSSLIKLIMRYFRCILT